MSGCKDAHAEQLDTGEYRTDAEGMMEVNMEAKSAAWVIRKAGAFYRPNRCGYTVHIEAAGLYTQEEAECEARIEPNEITAHPLSEYRAELERTFAAVTALLELIELIELIEGRKP